MNFSIGNTFDESLLEFIGSQNKKVQKDLLGIHQEDSFNRIRELYGCTRRLTDLGNARALDRLPDKIIEGTISFIKKAHSLGLEINWTVNAPCLGSLKEFEEFEYDEFFRKLERLGVDRLTIAHPLLFKLATESCVLNLEISTILNLQAPSQLIWFRENFGSHVDKFCVPIYRNRDFQWLKVMQGVCEDLGIRMELIVNEFCQVGDSPCEGLLRQSCYCHSSHAKVHENAFDYPMSICMKSRWENPSSWIKAPFILPQHLKYYREIGIKNFKVTGRTHPTSFLKRIMPSYMNEEYHGNLLGLWAHLETIGIKKDWAEVEREAIGGTYIDVDKLVKLGYWWSHFLEWQSPSPCFNYCICGEDCTVCDDAFDEVGSDE